jgi:radical SAM superfamily enzyme YgiQ (UPF0313 family)
MKIKVYLGDLVYDSFKTTYVVPLNIGYIAAYLDYLFPGHIDFKLFKFPSELERSLDENPPDLLALSHYSWNSRLDQHFLEFLKTIKPEAITVLGGPHVRTSPAELKKFLMQIPYLDYVIPFAGEKPMGNLLRSILGGEQKSAVRGCGTLIDDKLVYTPIDISKEPRDLDLPSPYLSGWLDPFIENSNMIPIFETNRGCPYTCIYCTWGISNLNQIRIRDMKLCLQEFDYVARNSAGQPHWIIADGNFGLLNRDLEIAKHLRKVMDKYSRPLKVNVYSAKNTTERNIKISELLGDVFSNLIAIQSADPKVLKLSGRGSIQFVKLVDQVNHYKNKGMEVRTDILLGLPGEDAKSHLKTILKAFDLGFDTIGPLDIRLLPGTVYESDDYREKYKIVTKFRPIFGASGVYGGRYVFELEESVRATKDMSENELNSFKVFHWFLYFAWNMGMFKPLLKFAQQNGANPGRILYELSKTQNPSLRDVFEQFQSESLGEWFSTKEEMILFYGKSVNFQNLMKGFQKLTFKYIAWFYQNPEIMQTLEAEMIKLIQDMGIEDETTIEEIRRISSLVVVRDLLQKPFRKSLNISGQVVSALLGRKSFMKLENVDVEIYRPNEFYEFCKYYLIHNGREDLSTKNIVRFLELGGCFDRLKNKVEVKQPYSV